MIKIYKQTCTYAPDPEPNIQPYFELDIPFYKVMRSDGIHRGLHYKAGLNIDPKPFKPKGECRSGGIYFANWHILNFLDYGPYLRKVTIPDGASVYLEVNKYKADKVVLSKREKITADVVLRLISEGAVVPNSLRRVHYLVDLAIEYRSFALLSHKHIAYCAESRSEFWNRVFRTNDVEFIDMCLRKFKPLKLGTEDLCKFVLNPSSCFPEPVKRLLREYFAQVTNKLDKQPKGTYCL